VLGENTRAGYGISGSTNSPYQPAPGGTAGIWGDNAGQGLGVKGTSKGGDGVLGYSYAPDHAGVFAVNDSGGYGVSARGTPAGHFEGDATITGTLTVNTDAIIAGTMTVNTDIVLPAADCAEDFDIGTTEEIEAGTVMVLDDTGALRPCQQAYDKRVAGVVSGAAAYRPGLILDRRQSTERRLPLALVGKVYCKVEAEHAPIAVGDLLTTSPTLGYAMKASDPRLAFGAVIGKALRPLQAGKGLVAILVALQ
jgi:hypothetical protein